jgi:arginine decarboxylase-like protein
LEAGSKPELLLAMSCLCKGNREAFLVCNGFKDNEYISLALVARKLALNNVIALEQEEELDMVVEISNKLCIRPEFITSDAIWPLMHSQCAPRRHQCDRWLLQWVQGLF